LGIGHWALVLSEVEVLGIGHWGLIINSSPPAPLPPCPSFLGQVFLIRQIFGILKPKPLSENLKLRSIIENILNYLSKA
jgi:hypothetical protein